MTEREKFEYLMRYVHYFTKEQFSFDGDGVYRDDFVRGAWIGWQLMGDADASTHKAIYEDEV